MKKLERKLSLSAAIAICIAGMLGGIFILPEKQPIEAEAVEIIED